MIWHYLYYFSVAVLLIECGFNMWETVTVHHFTKRKFWLELGLCTVAIILAPATIVVITAVEVHDNKGKQRRKQLNKAVTRWNGEALKKDNVTVSSEYSTNDVRQDYFAALVETAGTITDKELELIVVQDANERWVNKEMLRAAIDAQFERTLLKNGN